MHEAYVIGVAAGAGAAFGVAAAGLLARLARGELAAALVAAAAGAVAAWFRFDAAAAVAAAVAGLLCGASAGVFARGGVRRGGTAGGTAALLTLAGVVVFVLALVPVVGYVEAVALPALAVRARRRAGEKYAGLRTLAR